MLVVAPSIVKVLFKLSPPFDTHFHSSIVACNGREESEKVGALLHIRTVCIEFGNNFQEETHEKSEDSHSQEENDDAKEPFTVSARIEVAKADRRESCVGVVHVQEHHVQLSPGPFARHQVVARYECLRVENQRVGGCIELQGAKISFYAENVPKAAQEEASRQNHDCVFERSEDVADEQEGRPVGVIAVGVDRPPVLLLDHVAQPLPFEVLERLNDGARI